jgi:2-keto-4-pentenoate hydratase/2-oxohepta-3-ene-1,7-dioic acid hydratase in catechol pathway
MGPWLVAGLDPSDLALKTELNGKVVQSTTTAQLIFPVKQIIAFISRVMTLLPGDVIATGTTSGIGPMKPGDRVTVTIEGIGSLTNPVTEDSA